MLSGQQVVGQWGGVGQALQDSVEEARVAHVEEPCSSPLTLLPHHANLVRGKEDPFWRSHSLGHDCREIPLERDEWRNKSRFQLGIVYTSSQDNQLKPSTRYQGKPGTAIESYCSVPLLPLPRVQQTPALISGPQGTFLSHQTCRLDYQVKLSHTVTDGNLLKTSQY